MAATPIWDVIVAGAGPGGCATAIHLAEAGAKVLVLERETFPRFHIGESLLPAAELLVSALGVEPDPNVFLFKRGAVFVCEETGRSQTFDFGEALAGPQRYAWQVDRARFDTLLRDRAVDAGAHVAHRVEVDDVDFSEGGVRVSVRDVDGEERPLRIERARYFVDATGQDRLLARKFRSVRTYERFGRAAVFTHFSELSEATQLEFAPNNDIRIVMIRDGWLWAIPLTNNRLSVGLVSRKPGLRRKWLDDHLESSALFNRLLDGATRHDTNLIGNFSFENTQASGPRYCCVGDAACFIDPVFSSGVSLAIIRGLTVAERLAEALASNREDDPALMAPIEASMQRGYDTFAALVYRFYNTRFVDNLIFGAPTEGPHRAGVVSVLAGDVFRDDNPFQDMLLHSKRLPFRESAATDAYMEPGPVVQRPRE